jgi:hypothetical protein
MIRPAPMALVLLAALLGACGSGEEAGAPAPTLAEVEPRAPELAPPPPTRCAHYSEERLVFWGDLHVHTGISMDAWMLGTRLRPADASRFARGESIGIGALQ